MSEPLILIVDDDAAHLALLQRVLANKAQVKQFLSAESMLQDEALSQAHLIILDWELPGMNGLEALRAIRLKRSTPVLFLTSFDTESKVIAALMAGADDYLVKPFRAGELMARVQALLRRFHSQHTPKTEANLKQLMGGVHAEQSSLTITIPGQDSIKLSNKEFALGVLFFQNIGRALPRDEIIQAVWGREEDVPSRTLDTHVSRLRTRLNLRPEAGWRLTPVYSFGYRLDTQLPPPPSPPPPKPQPQPPPNPNPNANININTTDLSTTHNNSKPDSESESFGDFDEFGASNLNLLDDNSIDLIDLTDFLTNLSDLSHSSEQNRGLL